MDFEIYVSRLAVARDVAQMLHPSHVLSLLDPDMRELVPRFEGSAKRFELFFYDQERADVAAVVGDATRNLIGIFRQIQHESSATPIRLLIHCHAGASRSPAAAYIALALWRPQVSEIRVFEELRSIVPKPWPNSRMVTVADELLGRQGRLLEPLENYKAAHPRRLDAYRRLNRARGIVSKVSR